MSTSPNVELALSIDFLGTELIGVVQRNAKAKKTTIFATKTNATQLSDAITLNELGDRLVDAVASLSADSGTPVSIETPNIELPKALADIAENYRAYVKEAMFLVEKIDDQPAEIEYALWIGIGLDEAGRAALRDQPPFNVLMVNDLYLRIWNTTNEAILERMNFIDIEEILGRKALPDPQ